MASSKTVRKLAFAAMFQLDARNGADVNNIREGLAEDQPRADDLEEAMKLALAAWSDRQAADKAMTRLAPAWPAHRQALADRAILRLGHFELTKGQTTTRTDIEASPPKVIVNDMVALAKEYSTEKSPSFVNALLDKILKEAEAAAAASKAAKPPASPSPAASPAPPASVSAPSSDTPGTPLPPSTSTAMDGEG
jgi:N utilization substance protein B